jgi:predicted acetyltransferase
VVNSQEVALDVAAPRDAVLLSNLLELYSYDLSETFALELGSEGRFGYQNLPLYWSEPERRFPFFIRCGSRVVGFALATRGLSGSGDEAFDVAEFFVLRRYRRGGIGRQAAFLLWNRFATRWTVRVFEGNPTGRQFWTRVVTEYTSDVFTEITSPGSPHDWRMLCFDMNPGRAPEGS